MIPELGNYALALALSLALVQGTLPLFGAARGIDAWMHLARRAAWAQALCVAGAFAALVHAFVTNDFSVSYVAQHSNTHLPWIYRVAAVWGGHEGSVLLWALMLSGWSAAVAGFSRSLPLALVARVLSVMGLISLGLLGFLLFTSNPFERSLPAVAEGRDLNPLLQDPGMVSHPPLLYMGYVGLSVAFAFAVAALISGELNAAWARWTRPWTLWAWTFLTLGIVLGSSWAYDELGWGGWWFWDAVENASLMPWLLATALVHSLAVTEKRDTFRNWTVLLAILAFSLSLLGTFLVRSGVLSSVHAFASDPKRGLYILVFLAAVIGPALALYAWRAAQVGLGGRFAPLSRETLLMLNNVLLAVAAASVLLGTLYPLAVDALGMGKISVGPPYFEAVFVPLMWPLLALTAIGPLVHWKQDGPAALWRRVRWTAAGALLLAGVVGLAWQVSWGSAVGIGLAVWIASATLGEAWRQAYRGKPTLGYWGMVVAHVGLSVFVVGVSLVRGLETHSDHKLDLGGQAVLGEEQYTFATLERVQGPNYVAARARFDVRRGGTLIATLHPERRIYTAQQTPMTEAAIDRSLFRDLYITLGETTADGAWIVRVQRKPFMAWVWAGALAMALGGMLAGSDRRYRRRAPSLAPANEPSPHTLAPARAPHPSTSLS